MSDDVPTAVRVAAHIPVTEAERTLVGARERFRRVFRGASAKLEQAILDSAPEDNETTQAAFAEFLDALDSAGEEYDENRTRLKADSEQP